MKIRKPSFPAPKPRQHQNLLWALISTASLCVGSAWAAQPLPTDGVVKQGTATISTQPQSVVIQQQSARLLTDWRSFSIGAGHTVRFVQPSSQSIALNRVWGGDASVIAGQLQANGQVVLQNPQGVMFSKGAQVDVGSIVATSLRTDASLFMSTGQLHLSSAEPGTGLVVNEGVLRASQGGHVVLAGPQVENRGDIHTPSGHTALLAGDVIKVDPSGSGLLHVSVPVSAINARLAHSGVIEADGGSVILQTAAMDAALRQVMQVDGVVRARGVAQQGGDIWLLGGASGVSRVGGKLDASSLAGQGGAITVIGERVALSGTARLDASGQTGGGKIRVGGDFHGAPLEGALLNAQSAAVGHAVVLDASAKQQGDGGSVVVWADGSTRFQGQVRAQGGSAQGDGGKAEVSGKQYLQFSGQADLRAPKGRIGTLLLDPSVLIIGTVANLNGDGSLGDDLVLASLPVADFQGLNASITATRVASLLSTTDVNLQASSALRVDAPLTVAPGGAATTLTLQAPDIQINERLVLNNAALNAFAEATPSALEQIRVNAPIQSLSSVTLTAGDIGLSHSIEAPRVNLISTHNASLSTPTPVVTQLDGVPGLKTAFLNVNSTDNDSVAKVSLRSSSNHVSALNVVAAEADVVINNPAKEQLNLRGNVPQLKLRTNTGILQSKSDPAGGLKVTDKFDLQVDDADPVSGAVELTHPGNVFKNSSSSFAPVKFAVASSLNLFAADGLSASGTAGRNVTLNSGKGIFLLAADITSGSPVTPSVIDITASGFQDSSSAADLVVSPGGRFFVRSSDATRDSLRPLGFGTTTDKLNYTVLDGYTGPDPTTGNGFYTNRVLTITPSAAERSAVSRVYDGTTAFTYRQSGGSTTWINTSGAPSMGMGTATAYTLKSTGQFADKNVGSGKPYTVAQSRDVSMQTSSGAVLYGLKFLGFSRPAGAGNPVSQVTSRALNVTNLKAIDRVYDGTNLVTIDISSAVHDAIASDGVTLVNTGAPGTIGDKNAGTAKPVTSMPGVSLAGTDAGNYTLFTNKPTVNITPRTVTSNGITAVDRIYDGSLKVQLNTSTATSLSNVVMGDALTLNMAAATGSMADKNVGVSKAVKVSGLSLDGTDQANYILNNANSPSVNITPRTVTSNGITAVDRTYDGSVQVLLNASSAFLSNVVTGDALTLNTATATGVMTDKNVGASKPVTTTGLALAGADAANYTLTDVSQAKVSITPMGISPSGIKALDRPVDGSNTSVTLDTSSAALTQLVPADIVSLDTSAARATVADPAPGTNKPVTVTGLVLGGVDAVNYTLLQPTTALGSSVVAGLSVNILPSLVVTPAPSEPAALSPERVRFEEVRFKQYLQGVSDAQEPFRRAMADALASGFGKENIRKQLTRGLVFETGLASPAIDRIEPAAGANTCVAVKGLECGKR